MQQHKEHAQHQGASKKEKLSMRSSRYLQIFKGFNTQSFIKHLRSQCTLRLRIFEDS